MKVAVLNYSGNVGKTTIAKHLLLPRMGVCEWVPVESINSGGDDLLNYRGREFKEVLQQVMTMENAVVDIGSSNIEQVFDQLRKLEDAHEDFDYFVIPTVAAEKQQADTLKIVMDMLSMDVDSSRIKLVFNQVPDDAHFQRTFGRLVAELRSMDVDASHAAVIHDSDLFTMIEPGQSIAQLVCADRNIKAEIAAEIDPAKKKELAAELIASRLAKGVQREMDAVFSALFPDYK